MPLITNQRSRILGSGTRKWWLSGGVSAANAIGVYQPKGAASLAASYINLANPGVNNAAPGTAPTFASATGWTFAAASSQYLTTGITPANDQTWSAIIRFSNVTGDGNALGGKSTAGNGRFYLRPNTGSNAVGYAHGSLKSVTPLLQNGVIAFAGATAYRNGIAESGAIGAMDTQPSVLVIGALMDGASLGNYLTGNILAVAIYNATLTAAQVLAVSAAMAAL